MRIIILSLLSLTLCFGCSKQRAPDCRPVQSGATIIRIAGPDSIRAGVSEALTLEVIAPDLCVSDIVVGVERIDDTTFHMDPVATYYPEPGAGCPCSVKARHYVRVYFSAPVSGNVSITTGTGGGSGPAYNIRVY